MRDRANKSNLRRKADQRGGDDITVGGPTETLLSKLFNAEGLELKSDGAAPIATRLDVQLTRETWPRKVDPRSEQRGYEEFYKDKWQRHVNKYLEATRRIFGGHNDPESADVMKEHVPDERWAEWRQLVQFYETELLGNRTSYEIWRGADESELFAEVAALYEVSYQPDGRHGTTAGRIRFVWRVAGRHLKRMKETARAEQHTAMTR